VSITDVTPNAVRLPELLRAGDEDAAQALLPAEAPYPLPATIGAAIGMLDEAPDTAATS
jgi:hypothetical protein